MRSETMNTQHRGWTPVPGDFIREELEARGWTQRDLAFILGCAEQGVNQIISGKRGISSEMAKSLGDAFDVSAELFANLQNAYDLSRSRDPDPAISRRAKLQEHYPIREMIKRGWLENVDIDLMEAQMARFFGVSDISNVPYMAHAARKTDYDSETCSFQRVWLERVRQIATDLVVPSYSESKLKKCAEEMRNLTTAPEETRHVAKMLNDCGVRFVVVETLPNAKIDGACFWLNKKSPVIGMTLKYDRIDNFWFVLRHEIEHVLRKDGQETPIIDNLDGENAGVGKGLPPEEIAANTAAASFCVPEEEMRSYMLRKAPFYYRERDVIAFSRILKVHPGIIVGQIQNKLEKYDFLRKHLVKVRKFVTQSAVTDGWGEIYPIDL